MSTPTPEVIALVDALRHTTTLLHACLLIAVTDAQAREIGMECVDINRALLAKYPAPA